MFDECCRSEQAQEQSKPASTLLQQVMEQARTTAAAYPRLTEVFKKACEEGKSLIFTPVDSSCKQSTEKKAAPAAERKYNFKDADQIYQEEPKKYDGKDADQINPPETKKPAEITKPGSGKSSDYEYKDADQIYKSPEKKYEGKDADQMN